MPTFPRSRPAPGWLQQHLALRDKTVEEQPFGEKTKAFASFGIARALTPKRLFGVHGKRRHHSVAIAPRIHSAKFGL